MKFLIYFNNDHHWVDFRYAELYSLLCMIGIDDNDIPFDSKGSNDTTEENYLKDNLFIVDLPDNKHNDIVHIIRTRSVLVKGNIIIIIIIIIIINIIIIILRNI